MVLQIFTENIHFWTKNGKKPGNVLKNMSQTLASC